MLRKGKGLTLVEIIVAMAVFAIVVTTLLPVFIYVARLNVVSKTGIDVTTIAQNEVEKFYGYSRNNSFVTTIALPAITSSYDITTGVSSEKILTPKISDGINNITVTFWNNTPSVGMTKIRVVVSLINNTQGAQPEQVDSILIFKAS